MSREEYLTWAVQQDGCILSLEGCSPEDSYTSEEINAEYERQRQEEHDSQDRHHNVEFNML